MTSFGVISSTIVRCKNLRMNALMMFITMKNLEFRIDQNRQSTYQDSGLTKISQKSVCFISAIFALWFLAKNVEKLQQMPKSQSFLQIIIRIEERFCLFTISVFSTSKNQRILGRILKFFWSIFILKTWHISNTNGNFTDHWLCFQVIWIAHTSEQTTLTLVI